MSISNQKYYLDLSSGTTAPVTVHVSQGDVGRTISFEIRSAGKQFIFSGESVTVHGTRIDGANFGPISCTYSGSVVSFDTVLSMTAVEGSAIAELSIVNSSGQKVGTANFAILIENSAFPDGVSYSTDPSVYEDILKYVQSMNSSITTNAINTARSYTDAKANTINAAIANEKSARETSDNAINNRISNLVIASSSPNIAEVVDARTNFAGTAQTALKTRLDLFLEYSVKGTTEDVDG